MLSFMATDQGSVKDLMADDVARRCIYSVRFARKQLSLLRAAGWITGDHLVIPSGADLSRSKNGAPNEAKKLAGRRCNLIRDGVFYAES